MANTSSRKRTKFIPTRQVSVDTFYVTDEDGNMYYPHAGESIKFKESLSLGVLRSLASIRAAQADMTAGDDDVSATQRTAQQSVELFESLIEIVFGQIIDWTLTTSEVDEEATAEARKKDPDADLEYVRAPRPSVNREEAFKHMWTFDIDFLNWLQENMMVGATVPNASNLPSPGT